MGEKANRGSGVAANVPDVQRELARLNGELQAVTEAYRAVVESTADAIVTLDHLGHVTTWNRGAETMFQRRAQEMRGRSIGLIMPERYRDQHEAGVARVAGSGVSKLMGQTFEVEGLRGDGTEFPIELTLSRWESADGVRFTGILRDITDRKMYERQLEQMALHDPLTGLPNRTLFLDRLERAIKSSQRSRRMAAVLFLDLDGFKRINDELGHPIGDRVLRDVGKRLTGCLREADSIGRFGGDEFTVLLADLESRKAVVHVADRLIACTRGPMADTGYLVGVSIGISLYPSDGATAEALVTLADTAMYRAKQAGRGCYRFYDGG